MNRRGGQSTGSKKKSTKIHIPSQNGFTIFLLEITNLKSKHGEDFAVRFVEEAKKRFHLSEPEFEYALSIAKGKVK